MKNLETTIRNNNSSDSKLWHQKQKVFFDSRTHKRMWFSKKSLFIDNALERLISFVDLLKTQKILEIGCGPGRYTIPLIQRGYNITGIDISPRMIDKLVQDALNLNLPQDKYHLICGDYSTFEVAEEEKFDVVLGFNVLHHLFNISDCFRDISKVMKKGGITAFIEPNGLNPFHYIDSLLERSWKIEFNKSHTIPSKVRSCLEKNNFSEIKHFTFGFLPPFLIDNFPGLLKLDKDLEKLGFLSKLLPHFVIKGVKNKESGD